MAKITIPLTGLWSSIRNSLNSMFNDVYGFMGWFDYNDSATATTPIAVPGTSTYVYLTNNGLGAFTNKSYKPDGIEDIFNTSTNSFDFSSLSLGDTVDIRLDISVTTSTANQTVDVDLEMASGSGANYDILFAKTQFKTAGEQPINRFNGVYMGDSNTKDFPARFKIRSDAAATVVVNGWYCRVIRKI